MFSSTGILRYSKNPIKLIVEVDPDIARLYRFLIPKYTRYNSPAYPPHISVVRKCTPPFMENWGKYEGYKINFEYNNYIFNDELYFWLSAYSAQLEDIRKELGLEPYGDVTLSPDFRHRFHITIANLKNI